ncbi:oligosaccharide flippase family protein [Fulvivirga ulvae]|uniref:oligosaccharide flippase family protein n=1 Tax=Fulvivirga ulvae TaxID=2904245 RepID=UPI001F4911DF|nr:oligosaccharide flippase family protein [Fulvivirga ulvae]UII32997.1 oligosaccharide flippase family protein [Fulvivirga ulvae]
MNLQKLLLKQFFSVGAYKYLGELIFFLSSVVISRLLAPEEFGVIAMATIFYSFLMRFTDMGVTESAIREAGDRYFYQRLQNLFLLIGFVVAVIMGVLAYPISVFFNQKELFPIGLTYAVILFLYAFPKAMIAYLKKEEKLVLVAKVELVVVVFQVVCTIIFAGAGFSYWSLVLPHLFAPVLYYSLYQRFVKLPLIVFSVSDVKNAWFKVKALVYTFGFLNFIQYWEKSVDKLWVGKLYGETGLGLYNRAYSLMIMPVSLIEGLVNNTLLPILANKKLNKKQVKKEMINFIKLASSIIVLPIILFSLFPFELSVVLWGREWSSVGAYLSLLSIALIVMVFNRLAINIYIILRKERFLLISGGVSGILLVSLITVGAFYSIETMIYLYLASTLFVSLPLTCYLGFFKSFNFSIVEILDVIAVHYFSAILLYFFRLFGLNDLVVYPIILLFIVSVYRIVCYIRMVVNNNG